MLLPLPDMHMMWCEPLCEAKHNIKGFVMRLDVINPTYACAYKTQYHRSQV